MLKNLITFAVLMLALGRAQALPGNQWHSIIDRLEQTGVKSIGDLRFNELRQIAKRINWHEIQGPPPSVMSGSRQSGYNIEGNAYVGRETNPNAIAEGPVTELHELLGAARIADTDYGSSLALVELSQMAPGPERTRLIKFYGNQFFRKKYMRMVGGSSVSGGGDWTISSLKRQILEIIQSSGRVDEKFRLIYGRTIFEPTDNDTVSLEFGYTVARGSIPAGARIAVYFPRARFANGDRNLAIEIAQKLTEIFPARAGVPRVDMQPSACRGTSKTVAFPPTQDSSVRAVQDVMGGWLKGCKHDYEKMYGFTGRSVITPGMNQRPREVGKFTFDCTVVFNGQEYVSTINTARGVPMLSTIGSPNEVFAMARVSEAGELTEFRILPKGGKPIQLPVQPSTSGGSTSAQTPYGPVTLTCVYSRN